MTRDEIMRMAREAGWPGIYAKPLFSITMQEDDFLRFAALIAAAKRKPLTAEKIEAIADSLPIDDMSMPTTWHLRLARAIERAHGIGGEE
jgi:hypothetical protein